MIPKGIKTNKRHTQEPEINLQMTYKSVNISSGKDSTENSTNSYYDTREGIPDVSDARYSSSLSFLDIILLSVIAVIILKIFLLILVVCRYVRTEKARSKKKEKFEESKKCEKKIKLVDDLTLTLSQSSFSSSTSPRSLTTTSETVSSSSRQTTLQDEEKIEQYCTDDYISEHSDPDQIFVCIHD